MYNETGKWIGAEAHMLKIGIYTNKGKDPGLQATDRVIGALEEPGGSVCYDSGYGRIVGFPNIKDAGEADALFYSGRRRTTILRAARKYVSFGFSVDRNQYWAPWIYE